MKLSKRFNSSKWWDRIVSLCPYLCPKNLKDIVIEIRVNYSNDLSGCINNNKRALLHDFKLSARWEIIHNFGSWYLFLTNPQNFLLVAGTLNLFWSQNSRTLRIRDNAAFKMGEFNKGVDEAQLSRKWTKITGRQN